MADYIVKYFPEKKWRNIYILEIFPDNNKMADYIVKYFPKKKKQNGGLRTRNFSGK